MSVAGGSAVAADPGNKAVGVGIAVAAAAAAAAAAASWRSLAVAVERGARAGVGEHIVLQRVLGVGAVSVAWITWLGQL